MSDQQHSAALLAPAPRTPVHQWVSTMASIGGIVAILVGAITMISNNIDRTGRLETRVQKLEANDEKYIPVLLAQQAKLDLIYEEAKIQRDARIRQEARVAAATQGGGP